MNFRAQRYSLVEALRRRGYIKTPEVEEAMLSVPREHFMPSRYARYAYVDTPFEIGSGQTISAPHMVAMMAECLELSKGHRVFEVGTGSGYHAAVVAHIIGEKGRVYTMERIGSLAETARENLRRAGYDANVEVFVGDGSLGLPEHAPYHRILVTCAAPEIPPPLVEQLAEGGIIVIPVGVSGYSDLTVGRKVDGRLQLRSEGGCAFVPLIGRYGHG